MDPIIAYLNSGELPEKKIEIRILRIKATRYTIYDDKLYRRGYSIPLLKCVTPSEAYYIMTEIHEGICGNNTEKQSLAFKALRQGYYWPTKKSNCMEFSRKCDKCQCFAPMLKFHLEELTTMTFPWPFIVWGIDLVGHLPKERGGAQYAMVAVDCFMKWVEVEALASITPMKIKKCV